MTNEAMASRRAALMAKLSGLDALSVDDLVRLELLTDEIEEQKSDHTPDDAPMLLADRQALERLIVQANDCVSALINAHENGATGLECALYPLAGVLRRAQGILGV